MWAWKAGAKKLKVKETIDHLETPKVVVAAKAGGSILDRLCGLAPAAEAQVVESPVASLFLVRGWTDDRTW